MKVFNYILNFWNYFSNLGVKPEHKIQEKRGYIISNQAVFTAVIIYLIYFIIIPDYLIRIVIAIAFLLTMPVLILNNYGYNLISRFIISIIPATTAYIAMALTNKIETCNLFILVNLSIVIIPVVLFKINEWLYMSICILILFVYYFSFDWINSLLFHHEVDLTTYFNLSVNYIISTFHKFLIFKSTFSSFTNFASYKERAISVEATAKEEISSVFFKKTLLESEIGAKESKTLDMS